MGRKNVSLCVTSTSLSFNLAADLSKGLSHHNLQLEVFSKGSSLQILILMRTIGKLGKKGSWLEGQFRILRASDRNRSSISQIDATS